MKKPAILAIAAFVAAIAAAQTGPSNLQIVSSRLTANDLKADVSFLASAALQGRATPSPGLEIASEYIAAQFRRAGLDPAVLHLRGLWRDAQQDDHLGPGCDCIISRIDMADESLIV